MTNHNPFSAILKRMGVGNNPHAPRPPTTAVSSDGVEVKKLNMGGGYWLFTGDASLRTIEEPTQGVPAPYYEINVGPDSAVILVEAALNVRAGLTVTGQFVAWNEDGEGELRARISRYGSGGPNEQTVITRSLKSTPVSVSLTHTFESAHDAVRLQIDTRNDATRFFIARVRIDA